MIDFTTTQEGLVAFEINGQAVGDEWKKILVVLNGSGNNQRVNCPGGLWTAFSLHNQVVGNQIKIQGEMDVNPYSACILFQK